MLAATVLAVSIFQPPAFNPMQLPLGVKQGEQRADDINRRHQEILRRADELLRESEELTQNIKRLLKDSNEKLDKIEKMLEEKKRSKQK